MPSMVTGTLDESEKEILRSIHTNGMTSPSVGIVIENSSSRTETLDDQPSPRTQQNRKKKKKKKNSSKLDVENVETTTEARKDLEVDTLDTADVGGEDTVSTPSKSRARKLRRQRQKQRLSKAEPTTPCEENSSDEDVSMRSSNHEEQQPVSTDETISPVEPVSMHEDTIVETSNKGEPVEESVEEPVEEPVSAEVEMKEDTLEISNGIEPTLSAATDPVPVPPTSATQEDVSIPQVLETTKEESPNVETPLPDVLPVPVTVDSTPSKAKALSTVKSVPPSLGDMGSVPMSWDDVTSASSSEPVSPTAEGVGKGAYADDETNALKEDCTCAAACALM